MGSSAYWNLHWLPRWRLQHVHPGNFRALPYRWFFEHPCLIRCGGLLRTPAKFFHMIDLTLWMHASWRLISVSFVCVIAHKLETQMLVQRTYEYVYVLILAATWACLLFP